MNLPAVLAANRIIPVVTARDPESTVKLAGVLHSAGMNTLEITLRTDCALDSIRAVKSAIPALTLAAGTVTSEGDVSRAIEAGADFLVSPGISAGLIEAAQAAGEAILPGVASASEIMLGMSYGLDHFKLFPAVACGGVELLRSFQGPFPDVRFCPTGGLSPANAGMFLSLGNVVCCGGSWMVTEELTAGARWSEIETLAREALSLQGTSG